MNERSASTLFSLRRARLGLMGLLLAATFAGAGNAEGPVPPITPFQFSIVPGVQIFSQDVPVWGLDFNLAYGSQQTVFGVSAGLVNEVSENLSGIGVGLVNVSSKDATGLQAAVGNGVSGRFRGLQVALFNVNDGTLEGIQISTGNVTKDGFGLQVGLYNQATSFKGLQIGLFNVNENGFLPFFPGINIGF